MKAIKLASVFAVSAVAAAVSSTTFAAAPAGDALVITGEAGVEYVNNYGDAKDNGDKVDGTDLGELEFHVDNGIIYAELEVQTTGDDEGTDVNMEKLYVKQGALSFGRFDGSVSTGAFMGMDELQSGVDLNTAQGTKGDTDDTGIRYKVTPELTIAIEATESVDAQDAGFEFDSETGTSKATSAVEGKDSQVGVAFSYVQDFGGFKAGLSAGSIDDAYAANIGVQTVAGPATISLNYGVGETGTDTTTDVKQFDASIALAATDDLTLTLQYSSNEEDDVDGTYFVAEYAVGDLVYYYKNYNGDLAADSNYNSAEQNIVGVKAFF